MKKPTREDLQRITKELNEMYQYFQDIHNGRDLLDSETNVVTPLIEALDRLDDVLFYLPDIRFNVFDALESD